MKKKNIASENCLESIFDSVIETGKVSHTET